ncbi:hypothetical protein EV693_10898, partial [Nicoletella semolina]
MQKSVFSLKKSVIALAVLSVSGVGATNINNSTPEHLSIAKIGVTNIKNYPIEKNKLVLDNVNTELSLLALNSFAEIANDAAYVNGLYKRINDVGTSTGRTGGQLSLLSTLYSIISSSLDSKTTIVDQIKAGTLRGKQLSDEVQNILTTQLRSRVSLNILNTSLRRNDPKDAALIAALKNQSIINQKLQELTVGSHKQLKLDIDRLDDVVKGHREEINWLKSDLEDAVIGIEGNSNQIAEVSYDLADLQSEVEYTTSTMREDIAEAHEAIVLLDRADEIQFERLNEIAKVNEEINYRQDSQLREKADKSALMGLERLVVKNISGIEKNAEGLVQLGNEVSSGFKKAQTALNELSVEVEEGFNRTGKAVNALKEKEVEQDKRLNVVEFGVGTLVEAVQGKADN